MSLANMKRQIEACQSLDDLIAMREQLNASYRKQYKLLEDRAEDARKQEQWERLNQPTALKAGDSLWVSSELSRWYLFSREVRLREGTKLTVVAIQPRAKRIWVKTPPGFDSRPEVYFDDWRELQKLRREESGSPVTNVVPDSAGDEIAKTLR